MALDLSNAVVTDHCRVEIRRRGITEAALRAVLSRPRESYPVRPGRLVIQSVLEDGYLLRVFVDINRVPAEVVTAYRTSKIAKYSRPT